MVYAVMIGEYSDWHLVGYCETKEQANAYCNEYNATQKRAWENDMYVIPLANLENEKFEGKQICYSVDTRDWSFWREHWYDDAVVPLNSVLVNDGLYTEPTIQIWIYPADVKRIKKIAQDRYAQWKAEKEGII